MVTELVLVNLGTPVAATPAAVRAFLAEFLADPAVVDLPRLIWRPILHGMVLRRRPARVARQYQAIWTANGSPLRSATERIVAGVAELGQGRVQASAAYRYGEPSLASVLRQAAQRSLAPIVIVPLFPQATDATTGTVFALARTLGAHLGVADRIVERLIRPDDPGYIRALADRWQQTVNGNADTIQHLVVSFHGIPIRYNNRERRVYSAHCEITMGKLLQAIGWPRERATLAYQSKFGPEPWLRPATADVLAALPAQGVRRAAIIAPGFLTEGLETLEELAIRGRETFVGAGGEVLQYVPAVEDHPAFLESLVSLAQG